MEENKMTPEFQRKFEDLLREEQTSPGVLHADSTVKSPRKRLCIDLPVHIYNDLCAAAAKDHRDVKGEVVSRLLRSLYGTSDLEKKVDAIQYSLEILTSPARADIAALAKKERRKGDAAFTATMQKLRLRPAQSGASEGLC